MPDLFTDPDSPTPTARVIHADCLEALRDLPDASVDSIVTDPPYELGFMGKSWDAAGIAYSVDLWRECLRVLKPGGHALVFGGARTYHRMVCAMEDAGFEIRDSIHWVYGSGFPKSLDVSKAIDKAAGAERKTTAVVPRSGKEAGTYGAFAGPSPITAPATDDARTWQGWGTALKPAHEPIVVARKPLAGTVAQTVLAHGTGALNIDGCRVGASPGDDVNRSRAGGFQTEYVGGEQKDYTYSAAPSGRFPANFVLTHAPGCRATGETRVVRTNDPGTTHVKADGWGHAAERRNTGYAGPDGAEATPVYRCEPGCPVAEMDKQSGLQKDGVAVQRNGGGQALFGGIGDGVNSAGARPDQGYGGEGGASRFFTSTEWDQVPFVYQAKAAKRERPVNPETGKGHPTVKPLELMRWLVRLVTPPGGVVLEPFAGSGATVEAALLEGMGVIAVEREAEYLPLIEARVTRFTEGKSPVKKTPKPKRSA